MTDVQWGFGAARKQVGLDRFESLPGIGPSIAEDLRRIGVHEPRSCATNGPRIVTSGRSPSTGLLTGARSTHSGLPNISSLGTESSTMLRCSSAGIGRVRHRHDDGLTGPGPPSPPGFPAPPGHSGRCRMHNLQGSRPHSNHEYRARYGVNRHGIGLTHRGQVRHQPGQGPDQRQLDQSVAGGAGDP